MTKHKKYTYPQIVKIVGYKVVNKWDTGQNYFRPVHENL